MKQSIKNMRRSGVGAVVIFLLASLAGCASTAVPTRYYDLRVERVAPLESLKPVSSLGLRSIELPEMLERSGIVSYQNDHGVEISDRHAWAGQLKQRITWVISENLAQRLNQKRVWIYPWPPAQRPELQLRISIDSLVGSLSGLVTLQAHWVLYADEGKTVVDDGMSYHQIQVEKADYAGYVGAINKGIDRFSDDLAKVVVALGGAGQSTE